MVDVSTRKKLTEFLEKQPRDVVVVFAARAALRALPAIIEIFEAPKKPENFSSAIISPILYGMATALSAGTWSDRAVEVRAADAARAARAAYAADAAAYAADAAAYAVAYAADAKLIADGHGAVELSFLPLWPEGDTPEILGGQWKQLKSKLHALGEDWQVWTEWYETILPGGARNPDLEIARISFPPKTTIMPLWSMRRLRI